MDRNAYHNVITINGDNDMIEYWILFLVVTFWLICNEVVKVKKNGNFLDGFIIFILITFSGFRIGCDNDYDNYLMMFHSLPENFDVMAVIDLANLWEVEKGFFFFMYFCKLIISEFWFFTLLVSGLTVTLVWASIKRLSPCNFRYAFYLYFCSLYLTQPFTQMRFGLATAFIAFFCSLFLNSKKNRLLIKKIIFLLLAITNHLTAVCAVVFPVFMKAVKRPCFLYLVIIISWCLYLFVDIQGLLSLLTNISMRFSSYENETSNVISMMIFVFLILLLYIIAERKCVFISNVNVLQVTITVCLYTLLLMGAFGKYGILNRMSILFFPVVFCLYANLPIRFNVLGFLKFRLPYMLMTIMIGFIKFSPTINFVKPYKFIALG